MRAVVAYESMYGNTRRVAEAIAAIAIDLLALARAGQPAGTRSLDTLTSS